MPGSLRALNWWQTQICLMRYAYQAYA